MDDLGSLVKHYGIKPGGKSSPMIASKTAKKTHVGNSVSNQDPIFSTQSAVNSTQNPLSGTGFPLNFQIDDDIFGLNQNANISSNVHSSGGGGGGGGGLFDFDVEPVFENSKNKSFDVSDDLMAWGSSVGGSGNVGGSVSGGDLLSSDPVDDFWKKMGDLGLDQRGVKRLDEKKGSFGGDDDLLAGFSWSNTANDREASTAKNVLGKTVKQKETNFLDIDGILNGGSIHQEKLGKSTGSMFDAETPDLESMFRAQTQKNDKAVFQNRKIDEVPDFMFGNTISVEKKILPRNLPNDFLLFGDAQTSEQFKEINGESDSRREARYQRYLDTKARIAQAVADMNQREFEAKQEQEERHRAAETMGVELDRWKAGKEGNLRALLSSLQQVLGPEYGWRAVTLTDLITSSQVKIAYKKAALCVHPDKVQHKGAQQKYVAEKVFDLLKEAWNKFNAEELR